MLYLLLFLVGLLCVFIVIGKSSGKDFAEIMRAFGMTCAVLGALAFAAVILFFLYAIIGSL